MVERKKRVSRGIDSLQEQIELHQEKKIQAENSGMKELVDYYEKEIQAKLKTKQEKEELLKN